MTTQSPNANYSSLESLEIHKILTPLDFSSRAQAGLHYAKGLARRFGSQLLLLHVIEPIVYPADLGYTPLITDEMMDEMEREAKTHIERLAEQLRAEGFAAEGHLRIGQPYLEICEGARELGADLIVITTHGHTGLRHVLLGSTAERVVRYAPCPVMVIRIPETSQPESSDSSSTRDSE